jgi:hypothetical protein
MLANPAAHRRSYGRSHSKPRLSLATKLSKNPKDVALELLLVAADAARAHGRDRWEFALDVDHLLPAGVTATSLRELLCDSLIESAIETSEPTCEFRQFQRLNSLFLSTKTCFVLTDAGERAALFSAMGGSRSAVGSVTKDKGNRAIPDMPRPRWDRTARQLLLGDHVVKRYRVPSPCQETILQVFDEAGWLPYIDDPLPPHNGEDRRIRLRNSVKALNGHQRIFLLRFTLNGNGKGVHWEPVSSEFFPKPLRQPIRRR